MENRLKANKNNISPPSAASLLPHRFVTVRRGSPAAKSGQIRAGDRLEAVEGRSVVTLPHRELAQILRRAGNTLRLTIIPRPSTCKCDALRTPPPRPDPPSSLPPSSSFSRLVQPVGTRVRLRSQKQEGSKVASQGENPPPRGLDPLLVSDLRDLVPQRDSRYYSVDLDRGPSGFGFSLRGGSEYNMGLYVLGLMDGGPASRSQKMEVGPWSVGGAERPKRAR